MSSYAYLNRQNRTELEKLADIADFEHSKKKFPNKTNLAVALDKYLSETRDVFANMPALKEYYERLTAAERDSDSASASASASASPERKSPRKKTPKLTTAADEHPVKATPKSTRRRQTRTEADEEEPETADDSDALKVEVAKKPAPARTPASRLSQTMASALPPSPRVLADAIDEQTAAARNFLSQMWHKRVTEHVDDLRSSLSSVKAIETLVTLVEALSMMYELVPWRYFFTTPSSFRYVRAGDVHVKMPDVFILLTGAFWAPLSLWLLTSLILPLVMAYFFNISLKASSSHGRRVTRASTGPAGARGVSSAQGGLMSFDPLIFNIAKALICYLVYVEHFTFFGLFSHFSIERVNVSIPGQWAGMVTGAAVGVIGTLYEAILSK